MSLKLSIFLVYEVRFF